ncbi:tetratricopeptide repeat-containing sensor histidine kinase [Prolixibacter sp. SD074]|uniref:tetratricopeptide repeat-containing sensor histidine kinase n=1 Tax=Prolixibacter sp. SD074 TaxID=2652391 RepID=UPI001298FBE8|nr:tetratricopeptide repeat-containing sensor histidine kinase [Prolixibacter sp. SD074]
MQSSGELHLLVKKYDRYLTTAYDSSRLILPELLQKLDSTTSVNPDSAVAVMAYIAGREVIKGNIHLSDSLSNLAETYAKHLNDSSLLAVVLNAKGKVMQLKGRRDSAFYYYSKSLHLAQLRHDSVAALPAMINLGNAMIDRHNSETGINYLKEALELAKKRNNKKFMAVLYNNLGKAYDIRGSYAMALQYYRAAIDTLEKMGSREYYLEPLNNLANIYLYLGNDSLAMEYYQKVSDLSDSLNYRNMQATALINIGNLNYENNQNKTALKYTNEAKALLSGQCESYLHSIIYLNLGLIQRNLGETEKSFNELTKSIALARKFHIYDVLAEGTTQMAKYYENRMKFHIAARFANEAFQLATENNMLHLLPGITKLLADNYRDTGNASQALKFYDLYSKYNTQYQDTINNKTTRNFAFLYELQKKEATNKILMQRQQLDKQALTNVRLKLGQQKILILLSIVIVISALLISILLFYRSRLKSRLNQALISNNNEITEQNKLLEKENAFKNKLISIISHDIKTPLMSLYNILELLSADELSEEEKRELIRDNMQLTDRALNMVEDLLSWTRQQLNTTTVNYTTINVYDLGNEIITFFQPDVREMNINLVNACSPETTVYSDYQMLKMVIRNLFSNAMKFTPSGGYIEMGVSKTNGTVILYVADTGVGIKPEDQSKIFNEEKYFTTNGIRGEEGNGLGLKLCSNFVKKSGGKIWLESKPGEGSTFFIEIKRTSDSPSPGAVSSNF